MTHMSPTDKFLRLAARDGKIDDSSWVVHVSDDEVEVEVEVEEDEVEENKDEKGERSRGERSKKKVEQDDEIEDENDTDKTPSRRSLTFDERKLAWIEQISHDEKMMSLSAFTLDYSTSTHTKNT